MKSRIGRRARSAGGVAVRTAIGSTVSSLSQRSRGEAQASAARTDTASRRASLPFELLEARQMLSAAPAVNIAGPATTPEGSNYTLSLSSSNLGSLTINQWAVNWGDGISTTVGNVASVNHIYDDGPSNDAITASATLSNGTVLQANIGGTTVTNGLDPTFGSNGTLLGSTSGTSSSLVMLDNGQFIVGGSLGSSSAAIVRYNANGTVDTTFGTGGEMTFPTINSLAGVAVEHIADPNNPGGTIERLIVAGSNIGNPNVGNLTWSESVYCIDIGGANDGQLDPTFGTGGMVTIPAGVTAPNQFFTTGDTAFGLGIDSSGNIVVAGSSAVSETSNNAPYYLNVTRITPAGLLDPTFGTAGQTLVSVNGSANGNSYGARNLTGMSTVLFGSDGSLVVPTYGGDDIDLVKLSSTGTLENYGNSGIGALNPTIPGGALTFNAATLDANGNIWLGGYASINGNPNGTTDYALVRVNYNTGQIDTTFGAGINQTIADPEETTEFNSSPTPGVVVTQLDQEVNQINALAVTSTGQIIAGGTTTAYSVPVGSPLGAGTQDLGVARYNADGSLDTTFGDDDSGVTRVDFNDERDVATAVAAQPNGQVLVAGTYESNPGYNTVQPAWELAEIGVVTNTPPQPVSVSVTNVAPTAAITSPAGTAYEGSTLTFGSFVSDPSHADTAAGFTFNWSVTDNGAPYANASGLNQSTFSFTPDDNGTYVVSMTATDKDGGVSAVATDSITVLNVAPTVIFTNAVPTAGFEGTAITLTGSASDPSSVDTAAGFTFTWTVTDNGAAYSSSSATNLTSYTFTPDDNGSYVVALTATDKDGGVSTPVTDTIAVANVAPTPTITSPVTTGLEGSAISLSGSATDPSTVDTAAGLALGWSVTKNGAAYSTGSGSTYTFTPNDNGTYVVTLSATDKDGGVGTTTDTIAVANVPPTPTITAPVSTGLEGSAITLSGSATDPSTVDTAAGLALAWSVTKSGAPYATGTGASFTFTPNDNATYVVTLSATDKDGGVGTTTDTIAVANVPPTPTITTPVSTGLEGSAITLSGSATDPSTVDTAAGLALGWSVTKNGAAYSTGTGSTYTFTPNDNGTYVVTLSATDKDGGVGTTTDTIAVANVPPTPTITSAPKTGLEGSPITVTGSATDPSTVDTAAGLTLNWSVTKNGVAYSTGSGASYTFTPNDNATYVVTLTATDKDGGVGTTSDTIAVANVAPTATPLTGSTLAVRYQAFTLSSTIADPGTLDTHTVTWNFGDGSAPVTNSMAAGVVGAVTSPSHMYTSVGTYPITMTVTDKDGGTTTRTLTYTVDAAAIEADTDTAEAGKTSLFVGGTNGSCNSITVVPGCGTQGMVVTINGTSYSGFNPTGRIVVFGGGSSTGNDVIQIASNITLPTELYGGMGTNEIKGGGGPNIEVGGPNSDILVAGNSRDILIGAGGSDILVGGASNDLMVAMSTEYDASPLSLEALQREWTRTDISFAQQVADISNGGGLNGSVVLTSLTTTNDNAPDVLVGGCGDDEFVISNGDYVLDASGQDKTVDLSWVTT